MFWINLSRIALVLNLAFTAKSMQQHSQLSRQINRNRIYNSRETAQLLELERDKVVGLLQSGILNGRLVNGNYRITGKSIEDYLHNEI